MSLHKCFDLGLVQQTQQYVIMSVCESCKDPFIEGDIIATCCVCLSMFHCNEKSNEGSGKNCSLTTTSQVRVLKLRSKCLMLYRCKECRDNGGMAPQLVEVISNLQASVDKLSGLSDNIKKLTEEVIPGVKKEISEIKQSQGDLSKEVIRRHNDCRQSVDILEEKVNKLVNEVSTLGSADPSTVDLGRSVNADLIMDEISDRKYRENNILIYNVPEQIKSMDGVLQRDYDLKRVLDILMNIKNINTKLDLKNVKRLGSFKPDKVRPILVKFDNRTDATNVLAHWRLVPESVYISYDLTKFQRNRYNVLKNQANVFNNDEANKKSNNVQFVRFRNGNPVLVTASSLRKKQSAVNSDSRKNSIDDGTKNM